MNLKTRRTATAQELAEIHKHLGDAYLALHRAAIAPIGKPNALTSASQDALIRMSKNISSAMYSLEEPFVALTGRKSPFASTSRPDAWLEWLEQRGKDA